MELAPTQQEKLYSDIMAVMGTLKWTDLTQLITQVNGNTTLHEQVLAAILNYTKTQLKADVKYEDWTLRVNVAGLVTLLSYNSFLFFNAFFFFLHRVTYV